MGMDMEKIWWYIMCVGLLLVAVGIVIHYSAVPAGYLPSPTPEPGPYTTPPHDHPEYRGGNITVINTSSSPSPSPSPVPVPPGVVVIG